MLKLHISGMFRSGTTLICKMMEAHKNIACANDPYLPIFKSFRNTVEAARSGAPCNPERPLDDYYFDDHANGLMRAIQDSSLDVPLPGGELARLRADIARYTNDFSPDVARNIDRLNGAAYSEILSSAFDLVTFCNRRKDLRVTGFKSAWTNEFTKHILDADAESRVIVITRDARAVAASKNALPDKYPWLFLARQWRKQAAFAWQAQNTAAWRGRVLCIRYEDMVTDPRSTAQSICDLLGVDMDEDMLNAAGFKDAQGKAWAANSSHFDNVKSFNTKGIDRWAETLTRDEIAFMEYLCAPELLSFGYELTGPLDREIPAGLMKDPPRVPHETLAEWIRPFEMKTAAEIREAMSLEARRYASLYAGDQPGEETLRPYFLVPDLYRRARSIIGAEFTGEGSYG